MTFGTLIRLEDGARVLDARYVAETTALAWGPPSPTQSEIDGTWRIRVALRWGDCRQYILGHAHTVLRLRRADRCLVEPFPDALVKDLVEYAFYEHPDLDGTQDGRVVGNPYWYPHGEGLLPLPHRWRYFRGRAADRLEQELEAGWKDGMQDWPLEAADPKKIGPAMTLYDASPDSDLRVDVMSFLLYSVDAAQFEKLDPDLEAWLKSRLARDFALHGHTLEYWARLDDVSPDGGVEAELGWRHLTPLARQMFQSATVPLEIAPQARVT
jgi:hypothetical protein